MVVPLTGYDRPSVAAANLMGGDPQAAFRAMLAPDTLARAAQAGLKLSDHLDRNDAYGFFDALGDLLVTGPTHTNVNDFRALLVLPD